MSHISALSAPNLCEDDEETEKKEQAPVIPEANTDQGDRKPRKFKLTSLLSWRSRKGKEGFGELDGDNAPAKSRKKSPKSTKRAGINNMVLQNKGDGQRIERFDITSPQSKINPSCSPQRQSPQRLFRSDSFADDFVPFRRAEKAAAEAEENERMARRPSLLGNGKKRLERKAPTFDALQ